MTATMLAVYRHDTHKFNGRTHHNALDEFAGVEVNQQVPNGADGDAATLSRPLDQREPVVPTHRSPYRLSLLTGDSVHETGETAGLNVAAELENLITVSEADVAHEQWLQSDVAAMYNEAVAFPYTSLKYHTLLVAALLHHYRNGHRYGDLRLIVDEAETIVPHRTVYAGEQFSLRIATDDGRPSAHLGSRPCRSWASTWNRLTDHPLRADEKKWEMTLDANLRRIRAWSTALQYIEDFQGWRPDR